MASDDKRKFDRKTFFAEALLEFSAGRSNARISEISLGGCFVDSIASVMEGDPLSLTISAGSAGSQHFDGEIAYTLPGFGFGIRFKSLNGAQLDFLRKVIA